MNVLPTDDTTVMHRDSMLNVQPAHRGIPHHSPKWAMELALYERHCVGKRDCSTALIRGIRLAT